MASASELRSSLIALSQWVVVHRWDFVYRVAVALLLIAWLRIFPVYLLTIYTGTRGIPPFEMAADDLAGVHLMLTWTLLVLVLCSLYFWSPLIYIVLRRFYLTDPIDNATADRPPSRFALFLTACAPQGVWLFLPTVVISAALAVGFRAGRVPWDLVFHFWILSLLLTASVFLFVRRGITGTIVNWQGPLVFVLMSITLPFAFKEVIVGVLDSTLRQYRVGGMLPVTVHGFGARGNGADRVEGRLLLLGRRSIYIERGEGDTRKLIVIAHSEAIRVEIDRLRPASRSE